MGFSSTGPTGTLPHAHSNSTGDGGQLDESTVFSFNGTVRKLLEWMKVL